MLTSFVSNLVVGQRVDLEGDVYADPERNNPAFESEFETVMVLERETPDCLVVHFESGFACGFPLNHMVRIDPDQDLSAIES